jgi:hypothetical protein
MARRSGPGVSPKPGDRLAADRAADKSDGVRLSGGSSANTGPLMVENLLSVPRSGLSADGGRGLIHIQFNRVALTVRIRTDRRAGQPLIPPLFELNSNAEKLRLYL